MRDKSPDGQRPVDAHVNQTRRRLALGTGGLAAAMAFPAIVRAQPKRIPIAVVAGLTGRAGPWGIPVNDAVRLAVEQINAAGGIKSKGGAQIDLISVDHQSNPQMAGTQTERVIQVNNVLAVIGNVTSGATMVGSAVAEKSRTPMVSTDLGDSLTQRGMKYFFRIGAKASHLAATAVDFSEAMIKATGTKPRKVATMADDSTFSQDAIQGAIARIKKTDWDIQENVSFPAGKVSDFLPVLQRLKLSGVDLIFHALFAPDGIQIMRAMKTLNYDLMASVHIAGAPYTPEYVENLKKDAAFVTDAVGFVPELVANNPLLANYANAYKAKYRRDLDDQASLAVTCVGALYDALERAPDLSREALTEALRATDLQAGGNPFVLRDGVKFDQAGDNVRAKGLVMQLLDGQQRIVYPADIATTKPVWPMPPWSKRT
ncbi:receptor family ligand-binding protein [Bordetella bronchiseptica 99-R-0433]|uniref:ABC transporter substrate-binding protein n=1 Tax=Bordetella bronchiseptica TaxID=518 RepID=UPI00045AF27E|nr:ABC transporter substrate-binding protein [Bordetella bronchiseptica]KCV64501.1 receptor family ligand-binding protein [Bordetella bronchiseptica 99-R-0433]